MEYKKKPEPGEIELPDAQYRITLLMIMVLLLFPLTAAAYSVAVIAVIKGNYGVDNNYPHELARWLGLMTAVLISAYLGAHWYVMVRYYRQVTNNIFGLRHFLALYGLQVLNITVLLLTLWLNLYNLPIYMIPIILFLIVSYLIYLRRHLLAGKQLQ